MCAKTVLISGVNSEGIEPIQSSNSDLVAISPPQQTMKTADFDVVAESSLIIEVVLNDEACVGDGGGIGVRTRIASGEVVRSRRPWP